MKRAASTVLVAATLALPPRVPAASGAGTFPFVEIEHDVGLDFTHDNGATGEFYLPEIMGAGAALLDFDGDGDLDVFCVQGGPLVAAERGDRATAPRGARHRLFRNDRPSGRDGRWRFTDVTDAAGLQPGAYGMGAAVGDYDNDGDPDLYVTAFGPNTLLRNNGDGTFTDVTAAAGVDDPRWSTSAAFIDYDRDGDLDLFVANYLDFTIAGNKQCFDPVGTRDYCGPTSYNGLPGRLFRNDGGGRFADVTERAGLTAAFGPGLGVAVLDANADGWLDLFVANDSTANQLWINRGDGTFVDRGLLSGTALSGTGLPQGSMGIAVGDPDADGDEDLFVTNLPREMNVFYEQVAPGAFEDVTARAGLALPSVPFTGFGTAFLDYDHDGLLDLVVANGGVTIVEALRGQPWPYPQRNSLYHAVEPGRWRDVTALAGPPFERLEVSRGIAVGDLDNDGALDIVLTNNGGPLRVLRGTPPPDASWIRLRLEGTTDNRMALGARVGVTTSDGTVRWSRVRPDGSYLTASDPRVLTRLGRGRDRTTVVVEWPGGLREKWEKVPAGRETLLRQGTGAELAGSFAAQRRR